MQACIADNENGLELKGDLTVKTARLLFDQKPHFRQGKVEINLESVRDVDSAGLALLVHWSNQAKLASGKLVFVSAPAQLVEMGKISGLADLFEQTSR